ncbi:hypothetical protein GDO86_018002 [Hymenochirus boettgeri]|uniref:Uncharacterized protein n=1 Tax=Hymenochirus boettgeri TaxID=247094 RepID=A0A8T2IKL2_9PIPI|nr:hypothetical protein GDO86_018002 [Hymenochirus boettgeri]
MVKGAVSSGSAVVGRCSRESGFPNGRSLVSRGSVLDGCIVLSGSAVVGRCSWESGYSPMEDRWCLEVQC